MTLLLASNSLESSPKYLCVQGLSGHQNSVTRNRNTWAMQPAMPGSNLAHQWTDSNHKDKVQQQMYQRLTLPTRAPRVIYPRATDRPKQCTQQAPSEYTILLIQRGMRQNLIRYLLQKVILSDWEMQLAYSTHGNKCKESGKMRKQRNILKKNKDKVQENKVEISNLSNKKFKVIIYVAKLNTQEKNG